MRVTIDEGTVHMMLAAYRLGAGDPKARPPKDLLRRCVRMIEADTDEQARAALDGGK